LLIIAITCCVYIIAFFFAQPVELYVGLQKYVAFSLR